jgi:hypothetical protein
MIFVTNFRANDLNPSKGKQIEFNKGVIDTFFKFSNPEEDAVFLTTGYSLPFKSESCKAYKILAKNICNGGRKIYNTTSKYMGLWGSIRRGIKRSV